MMKRVWIVLLILIFASFVVAVNDPNAGTGSEDVEKIQGTINTYSPLDDSGDVDFTKYKPFKTKAEERIDNINLWLENNASWLSAIFGMVPALSWLFAINMYLWLFFFMILVLNGDVLFGIFSVLEKKIDLVVFETHWANLLGFLIFLEMLVTKSYVWLAELILKQADFFWNKVLPWGIGIAIVLLIVGIIVLILLLIYARPLLMIIRQKMKERKKRKKEEKDALNSEVLEKTVEGITGA